MFCRVYADVGIHSENKRTNVKRSAFRGRNPVAVNTDKRFNRFDGKRFVNLRNAQTVAGTVQTLHVLVRAEQKDFALVGAISL